MGYPHGVSEGLVEGRQLRATILASDEDRRVTTRFEECGFYALLRQFHFDINA